MLLYRKKKLIRHKKTKPQATSYNVSGFVASLCVLCHNTLNIPVKIIFQVFMVLLI